MTDTNQDNDFPRITMAAIERNIDQVIYTNGSDLLPEDEDGTETALEALRVLTVCTIVTKNGFTFVGTSGCVDPRNYDEQRGRELAREKAIELMWPAMGYELKQRLYKTNATENEVQAGQSENPTNSAQEPAPSVDTSDTTQ